MPMFQYEWILGGGKQELFNGDLRLSAENRFGKSAEEKQIQKDAVSEAEAELKRVMDARRIRVPTINEVLVL